MTDYSKMSDSEINRKVAAIIFPGDQNITPYSHRQDVQVFHKNNCNSMKDYCNNPADAWPIIAENMISIDQHANGSYARVWGYSESGIVETKPLRSNILRAAMIVFLMMKEAGNV